VKNLLKALLIPAVVLCALSVNVHAQSTKFNAIGSSAIFLEVGEAAYSKSAASCAWSTGTNGQVVATDTSTGSSLTDTGAAWVVWVPSGTNTCATDATPSAVYGYLQTDSVVGNRCLFNAQLATPKCSISYALAAGTAAAGKIEGASEVSLPASVAASLTGTTVNAAGTDIRPEDAKFATTRALTPCGSTSGGTGSIAPFLGLGYTNGGDILSFFSSSKFHVINFTLPATYNVQPIGLDPMVVTINSTEAAGVGFNNSLIKTITRAQLALYLDGSLGTTSVIVPGGVTASANKPTTVMVREPLSGTYNTMEYNVPNTSMMQTSQDVGVLQPASQVNCSGTVPASNPMAISNTGTGGGNMGWRYRTIGTGQELAETFATNNALGYSFWGVSNFAAAPATARYLMVDGQDPIEGTYVDGTIPTTTAQYAKVTFSNLANGGYPIWSLVRLVTVGAGAKAVAHGLALAAGTFSTSTHPDFLAYYNSKGGSNITIERSHFAPPGINFNATNQPANNGYVAGPGYGACTTAEAGGDVGGVILRIVTVDQAYCTQNGSTYGIINRRY